MCQSRCYVFIRLSHYQSFHSPCLSPSYFPILVATSTIPLGIIEGGQSGMSHAAMLAAKKRGKFQEQSDEFCVS